MRHFNRFAPARRRFTAPAFTQQTLIDDQFTRTVSNGWGTAPTGTATTKAWSIQNGVAADFSVNGTQAVNLQPWGTTRQFIGDANTESVEVYAEYRDVQPDTDYDGVGPILRANGTEVHYNFVYNGALDVIKIFAKRYDVTRVLAQTAQVTHNANFNIRAQAINSEGGVQLNMRYWVSGSGEPSTWNLSILDTYPIMRGTQGTWLTNQGGGGTGKMEQFVVKTLAPGATTSYRPFLGFHTDIAYADSATFWDPAFAKLQQVKAEVQRTAFLWNEHEPTEGNFNWTRMDGVQAKCDATGIKNVVFLIDIPGWANGNAGVHAVPMSGTARDTFMNRFAAFCTAAATRYAGRIKYWEVWNEPNENFFWSPALSGSTDTSRTSTYMMMYQRARDAIKAVDPNALVAIGGITGIEASGARAAKDFLQDLITAGIGSIDAVGIHPYSVEALDAYSHIQYDNSFIGGMNAILKVMNDNGMSNKKIWITEWGWFWPTTTIADQSAKLLQTLNILNDPVFRPRVELATYFALEDQAGYTNAGAFTSAGVEKLTGTTFKNFITANPR